nr:telomerase reverse transcriptase [Quercus suber]
MGKTKKRRRVPEVLWRLFRKRARSLACTIESLLPLSMSSLVRDEKDPSQYRKLLNQCFLVLSENAPPLSHFNPHSRWSQSQIVQRTIEMLISEQPMSSNVICNAYDKINHSNPIMELLCSPAWCLLLQRVGDDVMLYLLKHTSIFVPVPCKKHYQVSGPPISDLCLKFSNQTLESPDQPTSLDKCGSNKKRALVDGANSMLEIQKFSRDCVGSNVRRCSRSFSWIHGNKRSQMSLLEEVTPIIGIGTNNTEGDSNEELQKISNQIAAKSRKRSRPFSWLRHRKRKHLNFEETSIKTSSATVLTEKDNVSGRLQDDVNSCLNSCEKMPCFSVSQAPKSLVVANGAYINRKFMFYDMERSSSMFPGKHILNSLKSNIAGAKFLIGNIFGLSEINATQEMPCCQSSGFCVNKSACMYHSLVKLFKRVVRRTQCCQHLRLLDKHCAVPELNDTGKSGTSFKLNQRKMFLRKLMVFILHIARKLNLRESVDMHKGSRRLDDAAYALRHKLLESWIFWLFSCLVVPLVQDQGYRDLDIVAVRNIMKNRKFGFSKLRLRPKGNDMRMLANLKASSRMPTQKSSSENQSCGMHGKGKPCPKKVKFNQFKSVNIVLRDTHAVLKGILEEPEKLGSSVFDYNDDYRKLCPFLIGLKNRLATMPGAFVVVSDVRKAFDSIDQDKLLTVMKDIIQKDEYLLKESHQVVCTQKSLWVHKNLVLMDQNMSTPKVTSSVPYRLLHTVFVNQEWSRHVKKEELFFILKEHVKCNVLQFDKKFFVQGVGIPQGSALSPLLCSLYYGHLERNLIASFLEKTSKGASKDISRRHISMDASAEESSGDRYILLRFTDDYLFISTSKKQAASFFSRLQRGFCEYNCYMNDGKFSHNFDIGQLSGITSSRAYVGEDGISFLRWCGLLLNCCTLEVQADYTKYLNNHLSSTLTVNWQSKPGRHLRAKLCSFMRPKCHPIFFDSNINSAAVIRLNIYQAFLVCAMKFHCYVCDLSYICKLHAGFYLYIIERSLRYMYKLIKKRMRSAYHYSDVRPILQLEEEEVEWLGLYAYIQVLKRKESRHKRLISSLSIKFLKHQQICFCYSLVLNFKETVVVLIKVGGVTECRCSCKKIDIYSKIGSIQNLVL